MKTARDGWNAAQRANERSLPKPWKMHGPAEPTGATPSMLKACGRTCVCGHDVCSCPPIGQKSRKKGLSFTLPASAAQRLATADAVARVGVPAEQVRALLGVPPTPPKLTPAKGRAFMGYPLGDVPTTAPGGEVAHVPEQVRVVQEQIRRLEEQRQDAVRGLVDYEEALKLVRAGHTVEVVDSLAIEDIGLRYRRDTVLVVVWRPSDPDSSWREAWAFPSGYSNAKRDSYRFRVVS